VREESRGDGEGEGENLMDESRGGEVQGRSRGRWGDDYKYKFRWLASFSHTLLRPPLPPVNSELFALNFVIIPTHCGLEK